MLDRNYEIDSQKVCIIMQKKGPKWGLIILNGQQIFIVKSSLNIYIIIFKKISFLLFQSFKGKFSEFFRIPISRIWVWLYHGHAYPIRVWNLFQWVQMVLKTVIHQDSKPTLVLFFFNYFLCFSTIHDVTFCQCRQHKYVLLD